ncbi:MAG TPA: DUF4143 domain-containing protein [Candidatus Acidoferrales bacterium]|jgi:predicted AAA+ superfamily ATPase|nr:DUF4143 domain-containing protein [Candidatus Acidoferrales bacterium]
MIANSAQFAVSKVASDDLDLVHASKRGSPELYLADTGLLCALLNIRSEEALQQSPAVGAVWETFVFAQFGTESAAEGVQAVSSSGATELVK